MAITRLYIQTVISATLQISQVRRHPFLIPVSQRTAQPVTRRIQDGHHRHTVMRMQFRDSPRTTGIGLLLVPSVTRMQRTIQLHAAKAVVVILLAREVVIDSEEKRKTHQYTIPMDLKDWALCHTREGNVPAAI